MPIPCSVTHRKGDGGKHNWVFHRLQPNSDAKRCIIFFPGDISNFASPAQEYEHSLEGLFWGICKKFPLDDIMMIRAQNIKENFALYLNFLMVDPYGAPRHSQDDIAGSVHLQKLIDGIEKKYDNLVLVGFSKGSIVLNALFRLPADQPFWSNVSAVHFVDPGLHQPGMFPPFSLDDLRRVVAPSMRVFMHGTPRQFEDANRPYVKEEVIEFTERLKTSGLRCDIFEYFKDEHPCLKMHFDVLKVFKTEEDIP